MLCICVDEATKQSRLGCSRRRVGCFAALAKNVGRGRPDLVPSRSRAAEPPSSQVNASEFTDFATPPLRYGAFGVTASRRRGYLPPCPFGERCGRRGRTAHQRDMIGQEPSARARRWQAGDPRLASSTIGVQIWSKLAAAIRRMPVQLRGQPRLHSRQANLGGDIGRAGAEGPFKSSVEGGVR
jgi:hypothetical protein